MKKVIFKKMNLQKSLKSLKDGFTLFEVMVAMGILAISLVTIFSVQASSIQSASRVKNITAATLLARSKMIDLEFELKEEGFSDFAEETNGTFEEEGWPDFRWTAKVSKVKIPMPTSMPGQENNTYASMMSGYATMITDLISNALREISLTVEWNEGNSVHELKVATHVVETTRANMLERSVGGSSKDSKGKPNTTNNSKNSFKNKFIK